MIVESKILHSEKVNGNISVGLEDEKIFIRQESDNISTIISFNIHTAEAIKGYMEELIGKIKIDRLKQRKNKKLNDIN